MTARNSIAIAAAAALTLNAAPALAAKAPPPSLAKCEQSLGTIALVDGDVAGWTQYGLGSPRDLINALAAESGCFTAHTDPSSPARFLVTAVAGSAEEVDKTVEAGKSAVAQGLLRSGAAGKMLGGLGGFGGAALGMFGGLGGKKKSYAAGLRVVSPATGMAIASGTGNVSKTSISFGNAGGFGWASTAAAAAGYQGSKDGQALTEAFIIAFNQVVAQKAALQSAPAAGPGAAGPASAAATVAVDTSLYASASKTAAKVRSVRAGAELTPTGNREGLFIEVADNYGTKGWISVEDLK